MSDAFLSGQGLVQGTVLACALADFTRGKAVCFRMMR